MSAPARQYRSPLAADTAAMVKAHTTEEQRREYREDLKHRDFGSLTRFERLSLGHTLGRKDQRPFARAERRMAEINRLIEFRYGGEIPETDDLCNGYIFCMAHVAHAHFNDEADRRSFMLKWLARVASWIEDREDLVEKLMAKMHPRRKHLRDQPAGKLVNLKMTERQHLSIITMSPADLTSLQFAKARKEAKRAADRERAARKRLAQGAKRQSASITQTKQWEEAGFKCRRTWERWRARQASTSPSAEPVAISSHACTSSVVATSSPLIVPRIGSDEFATSVAFAPSTEPSFADLASSMGGGVSPPTPSVAPASTNVHCVHSERDVLQTPGGLDAAGLGHSKKKEA
ncbi:hypothetical protein C7441_11468 [Pseudaminobacter salicylatoxidans]|uniref:Uncharacterized protein n=1 Tax=Pseudaminobacter salicylatoxidans TaxID=93369 RepID=A0A316C062_PSESE|nr:hypothetical protein [Pseudaminobacter salicylatoxidans]PWJ79791.1 hypothetical protein C7441_11468 [Pseudaminobacter salicylatoxidans]